VPTDRGPFESAFTHDGRLLFVTNLDANSVSVLDTERWQTMARVSGEGFGQPHGVAMSPDGRYAYVSNRHQAGGAHDHEGHKATGTGTLLAICVPTHTVDAVIPVGRYAAGVGVPAPSSPVKTPAACR
jgi:YVTN family beta-propeller protein